MADPESLRRIARAPAPFSAWLGIVFLFALFGVIVLALVGPSPRGSDYEQTRAKKRMENLKKLREESEKELTTYGWVDKNKGLVRIPISRAMELTVAELAGKKPVAAGPIGTPPAQASPAGSASPAGKSLAPTGSPKPAAARPSPRAGAPRAAAPASSSPATQQTPTASPSPTPATTL